MRYSCCVWCVKSDLVCLEGHFDLKSGITNMFDCLGPISYHVRCFTEDKRARNLLNVTCSQSDYKVMETGGCTQHTVGPNLFYVIAICGASQVLKINSQF
ncbi:hypothetical protein ATANTOWER_004535 [Ataeniobius toweri]|uniref:Uncharacterized protein n=1 Tax=Ataeniobius toweri TaxID=208326 RepID=A0ABU7BMP2_9TELE|nr:hypothetical protein [Ataeniobius toweri]